MKSEFFDDVGTAAQILKCETALECKQLSKEISNYDHESWAPAAKVVCEQGIAAKFLQNENFAKGLLSTGEKTLVECSYDNLWGNGIPLQDESCRDQERWSNQGLLDEILMEIRSELKNGNSDITSSNNSVDASIPANQPPQQSGASSETHSETTMEIDQTSQVIK